MGSNRTWRQTVILGAVIAALAAGSVALGSSYGRTVAHLPFTTRQPNHSTGLGISIHYQDEKDPNAKPKTFHKLEITMPAGTRLDQRVVPPCTASDSELMATGPSACPDSKVGAGTVTLSSGFPPPGDLIAADVTVLQGQGELLDVFRPHGSDQTVAVDHLKIDGRTLIDEPQSVPGGPPDGRSAPRDVRLTIFARSKQGRPYLRTPRTCPRSRRWESRFTVFYDDSVTDVALDSSPCTPPPRMHLTAKPRRVSVGKRVRFAFRVTSPVARCTRGAVIRFAGRKLKTSRTGTAATTLRLRHAGARRVVASKQGCRRAVATIQVVAPDRDRG